MFEGLRFLKDPSLPEMPFRHDFTLHQTAILPTASKVSYCYPQSFRRPDDNKSLYHPFIPDLPIIRLSPYTDLQLRIVRVV
jgi:hypothetical protein